MRPKIKVFQRANRADKQECEWHSLCVENPAFKRWKQSALFTNGFYDVEFSSLAARAYSALFELRPSELPYCTPSRVMKISGLIGEAMQLLPSSDLLPGYAKHPISQQGLADLRNWRPRDLPEGVSGRGDPLRRWIIRKINEEFYYAFNQIPPVSVVGDLIRLGWPDVFDQAVRRVMNDALFFEVEKAVRQRRGNENLARTAAHQAIAKASSNVSREAETKDWLEVVNQHFAALPDARSRKRALSILQANLYEAGYLDDDGEDLG